MIEFLALYTGAHGPISAVFLADDVDEAIRTWEAENTQWYDDAEDALGLPIALGGGDEAHERAEQAARERDFRRVYVCDEDWSIWKRGGAA